MANNPTALAIQEVINQRDLMKVQKDSLTDAVKRVIEIHDNCRGEASKMHAALVDYVFDLRQLLEKAK